MPRTSAPFALPLPRALLLLVLAALALAVAVFPLWIIQPFKSQDPRILPLALAAFRLAPWITLLALAVVLYLLFTSFAARTGRTLTTLALVAVLAATALAHTNIYEKMFHPAGDPAFLPASALSLDPHATLMSVTLRGQTHAYPIRAIAYHHIINDRLAGDPIVATY